MQRMPQKDQRLSSSQQSLYYPPIKPRQVHYPIIIQVRRGKRRSVGEKFIKRTKDITIDKRYGLLVAILLLLFCLAAAVEGGNTSSSAQASPKRSPSVVTHMVQIVRPDWKEFHPTAKSAPQASAAHTSTSTPASSPTSALSTFGSQPFITFTAAYVTNHVLAVVSVHTLPGAALTIDVTYCGGRHASSVALHGIFYANYSGNYAWTWKPKAWCIGLATARVTASIHGQAVSQSDVFRVVGETHYGLLNDVS